MSDKTILEWTERDGHWGAKAGEVSFWLEKKSNGSYTYFVTGAYKGRANSLEEAQEGAISAFKTECEKWAEAARALGMPIAPAPQPMDTAPEDGTPILIEVPDGGWIEAYWADMTDPADSYWCSDHLCYWIEDLDPTRWMPKPQDEEAQS